MAQSYVTPKLFRFLKELEKNNKREWFNANKERYHEEVRDPLLDLIDAFAPRLEKLNDNFVADSRPVGGSLFRIYRDTRFSKDKRPYKTHAAMTFRHIDGSEVAAPGFYVHFEPGRIFTGSGMWHVPSDALKQVRDHIVAHPVRWKRARRGLDDAGDRLKRAPRGFDPEHPLVEDLKRKGFITSQNFTQKEACAPAFLGHLEKAFKKSTPLMEFLTEAVGLDW